LSIKPVHGLNFKIVAWDDDDFVITYQNCSAPPERSDSARPRFLIVLAVEPTLRIVRLGEATDPHLP